MQLEMEPPKTLQVFVSSKSREAIKARFCLINRTDSERQVAWEKNLVDFRAEHVDIRRRFIFWDAVRLGSRIWVLYSDDSVPHVDLMAKGPALHWVKIMSWALCDVGHADAIAQFFRDNESGRLGVIYKDSATHETRWVGFDQVRALDLNGEKVPANKEKK